MLGELKRQKHFKLNYQSYANNYAQKPSCIKQITYTVQQYCYCIDVQGIMGNKCRTRAYQLYLDNIWVFTLAIYRETEI